MSLESKIRSNPFLKVVLRPIWRIVRVLKVLQYYVHIQPIHNPSEESKREEILSFNRRSQCRVFVETGTFLGNTTDFMANHFDVCHTIELDDTLYAKAVERFKDNPKVRVHHGSSAQILPKIMKELEEPAFFWLDAHYSQGVTAGEEEGAPIDVELKCILQHSTRDHTVFIDDSRMFLGYGGYPTIRQLTRTVKRLAPQYVVAIKNDAIRIFVSDYKSAEEEFNAEK